VVHPVSITAETGKPPEGKESKTEDRLFLEIEIKLSKAATEYRHLLFPLACRKEEFM
jgi:hypothetical protein